MSRLNFALDVAYEAGRKTLALYNSSPEVDLKDNLSPVTQADRDAENFIRGAINRSYPGESILGEEGGLEGTNETRWVVDPIDGTKSFICGVPFYATLLSYEVEGVPEIGVAYFPALDWMVYAQRGKGAFSNGRKATVSATTQLERAVICCAGHKSMDKYGYSAGLSLLAPQVMATRTWSDAYGHCLVATGKVEAMIDPILEPYDVSSVSLIVTEAGGLCTTREGESNPRNQAISSNGLLHPLLLETFRN